MPALPNRLRNKPFKSQRELKHKRTRATLKRYAVRRAAYRAMQLLCLCVALSYFAPAVNEIYVQVPKRVADANRQRRHRARVKLLKKQARLQVKLDANAAKLKAAQARIAKREADLRKHATAQEGFRQGWCAEVPMTESQMMAQSYAKRFIREYLRAVAEKSRVTALMAVQQSKSVAHSATIKM
jgi:hypothetical protein